MRSVTHHREQADEKRQGADHGENRVLHHGGNPSPHLRGLLQPRPTGVGIRTAHAIGSALYLLKPQAR